LHCFQKKTQKTSRQDLDFGSKAIEGNTGEGMKAKADELVMRSTLLRGLEHWLKESGLTQTQRDPRARRRANALA
jgi:predicted XRE-type DNA-binding protein